MGHKKATFTREDVIDMLLKFQDHAAQEARQGSCTRDSRDNVQVINVPEWLKKNGY